MPTLDDLASGRLNSFQGPGGAAPAIDPTTYASILNMQGLAPSEGDSGFSANGIDWTRNQQTGGYGNPTSSNPMMQKLIDQGVFSFGANNQGQQGVQVDQGKLQSLMPKTAYGGFGTFQTPDVDVNNGTASIHAGNKVNVRNANAVQWDPNYGWITPQTNFTPKLDFWDKAGEVLPYAIAAGLTAGGMGAIGAVGGAGAGLGNAMPAFQSAGNAIQGGKFDPLSLASLAGGISPELARILPILQSGYGAVNAAKNIQTNPVGSGLSLARLAGGLYG